MYTKVKLFLLCIIVSPVLFAQGKLFIKPKIGFYSGFYKSVDSINKKQDIIRTKPFLGKDLVIGCSFQYVTKKWAFDFGVETVNYSSGYIHKEAKRITNRVNSKESLSEGSANCIYLDIIYKIQKLQNKHRIKLQKRKERKLFFITYAPTFGVEFRRIDNTFIQDYQEGSSIYTSNYGSISGSHFFHSYNRNHISLRTGLDVILNSSSSNQKFVLSLGYKFAFKDAGYFKYHFEKPSEGINFDYQNTTRGNGLLITAGFPIKLFELNKKNNSKR